MANLPLLEKQIQRIILLIDLKRLDQAQAEIQKGLATHPEEVSLYLLRSQCFEQVADIKGAVQAFLKILSLDPDSLEAHEGLARLYPSLGKKELAEKHLKTCLSLAPNDASILALASLIYSSDKPFKAQRLFKQAVAIDPNNSMVKSADSYHSLMGLKLGRFKKVLIQNMKEAPTSAKAMFGMGLVELSNGHFTQAADLLRQSYVKEPAAEKLDAWIDARLGAYWPFKWSVRTGWITYPFGLGFQLFAFLIGLPLFFLMSISWEPHFDNWLWYIHLTIALFLSLTYVLKYPIQYLYRRKYHADTPVLTYRDVQKISLFICTIMYVVTIFTKDISLLLGSVFFVIYLPLWQLVEERTHWLTKSVFYVVYGVAWASFIISNVGDWLNLGLPKGLLMPALVGWVFLFLGKDWAEGVEEKDKAADS